MDQVPGSCFIDPFSKSNDLGKDIRRWDHDLWTRSVDLGPQNHALTKRCPTPMDVGRTMVLGPVLSIFVQK